MSDKKPAGAAGAPAVSTAARVKNFAIGGCAGMFATCIIQPVDMIKVRI